MQANNIKDIKVINKLRVLRAEKNISQDDLAKAIGTTRATIGKIERGETSSTNITLALLLSDYFQKPVNDIFFITNGTQEQHLV